ncbi:MAG: hypothetical protein JXR37_33260 [Kiritimatiellae bacterium]|nr:hypothetical protein [Kiritimatiellia bacterium]
MTAGIEPYAGNPRYWQYRGEPALLVGGSDDENVFQWLEPEMERHLDLLVSVGGNYDRCTMTGRPDRGFEVYPWARLPDGRYDLGRWNEEYWTRFERYLRACHARDIVVQLELWATYDYLAGWSERCPFCPANNVNFGFSPETILRPAYKPFVEPFHFYFTVPELLNDPAVLRFQQAFADRVLSFALRYDNILYCGDNEYHPNQPPEWFRYWARHIKARAAEAGKRVQVGVMNQHDAGLKRLLSRGDALPDYVKERVGKPSSYLLNRNLLETLDRPDLYDYVDLAGNSNNRGQEHWDNLQTVRTYVAGAPRPINHDKVYGADLGMKWPTWEGVNQFWRNVLGGAASVRFHRPPTGLGLSALAQANIRAVRAFAGRMKPWECEPHPELLGERTEDAAYCLARPGERYGLYFTGRGGPGWVRLRLSGKERTRWTLTWINVGSGQGAEPIPFAVNEPAVQMPLRGSDYGWAAVVERSAEDRG